jgi:epoxyqueuosine reductase
MTPADWHTLSVEQYRALFKGSAVKRAKFEGLRRNIEEVERGTEEVEKKAEEVKRE